MTIFVNGEQVECGETRTLDELLQDYSLSPQMTLVEHNGVALRRDEWSNKALQPGDRIEILRVAAGG